MSSLRPFFTYYGGKWRAAPKYPPPMSDTIVEPFAGSAGYSMRWPDRKVVLVERDPYVAGTWRYLLSVSEAEVLALPDLEPGQSTDDLDVPQEARWLIGWWLNGGSAQPKKTAGSWMRRQTENGGQGWSTGGGQLSWGSAVRQRIASQLPAIRHWTLIEGDYTEAPDVPATWFVDPPYIDKGRHYRLGSDSLDYQALAEWCRSRRGQVMVCENVGADWLPFRPFIDIKASEAKQGGKVSREALWTGAQP